MYSFSAVQLRTKAMHFALLLTPRASIVPTTVKMNPPVVVLGDGSCHDESEIAGADSDNKD